MCKVFKVNKPVSKAAMMVRLQRQLVLLSDKNEGGARTAHETCCLSSRPDHVTLPPTPAPHIKNTLQYFIYTFFIYHTVIWELEGKNMSVWQLWFNLRYYVTVTHCSPRQSICLWTTRVHAGRRTQLTQELTPPKDRVPTAYLKVRSSQVSTTVIIWPAVTRTQHNLFQSVGPPSIVRL